MIATRFLSEIAGFTNRQVNKVVLNGGAFEIADFEIKQVRDNVVSMKYMVPFGSVNAVTSIELQSSDGTTISSNEVRIPIAADTLLLQLITVKEV